jgi:subtilisin family serine protease
MSAPTSGGSVTWPLELVQLRRMMAHTSGEPGVLIGLLDGPVDSSHPDLARARISSIPAGRNVGSDPASAACRHGTLVASILCARRGSGAPAICPGCTVLVRSIFAETGAGAGVSLSTAPTQLAAGIVACVEAGARVLNVSAALAEPSASGSKELDDAVTLAAAHGVLVIAAAGNQGTVGSWALTRHPWVIPVGACDRRGRPAEHSNLANSLGRRGLLAPGVGVISLAAGGGLVTSNGTSTAAPFVTGTAALLWSLVPNARASDVKHALTQGQLRQRNAIVPPLLNALRAYDILTGR